MQRSSVQPAPVTEETRWLIQGGTILAAKAAAMARKSANSSSKAPSKGGGGDTESQARTAALATKADTVGISFKGRAFQRLYFETKFQRRGQLLFDIITRGLDVQSTDADCVAVRELFTKELTCHGSGKTNLLVCSVGGGPGTDAAGLVLANELCLGFFPHVPLPPDESPTTAAAAAAHTHAESTAAESELCERRREAHIRRTAKHHTDLDTMRLQCEVAETKAARAAELVVSSAATAASAAATPALDEGGGVDPPVTAAAHAKAAKKAAVASTKAVARSSKAAATAVTAHENLERGIADVAESAASLVRCVAAADAALSAAALASANVAVADAAATAAAAAVIEASRLASDGSDAARAAGPRLHIALLDNEPQWRAFEGTLTALFAPKHATCTFTKCDVIEPVIVVKDPRASEHIEAASHTDHHANVDFCAMVPGADLFVFAYVTHETSAAAASNEHVFYRDLARHAKIGAVMIFADVQGRAATALNDVHAAMVSEIAGDLGGQRRIVRLWLGRSILKTLSSDVMILHVAAAAETDAS
eukprot:m.102033 g.102033  ORF g.102033 m.102033 type:complete len:539 (+) comp20791_c0_seq1:228-1844(+)